MNRYFAAVLFCLIGAVPSTNADSPANSNGTGHANQGKTMHISVHDNGNTTRYELNDSAAAKALYAQLPLTLKVEPYSDNEMIFYPPKKLATGDTPPANAKAGTLAYYAPWGDVVMFYKDFGRAGGLYELGHAVSGTEHIRKFSGTIKIKKAD